MTPNKVLNPVQKMKNYRNNPNLKSVNVHLQYTKEQIEEYMKCKQDPVYFITNYVKVVHVDKGLVPFVPYDYQIEFIEAMHNNRKVLLNTARQVGKTLTMSCYAVWQAIFYPNKIIAILANRGATAREILRKCQDIYESLPIWLQQGVEEFNKTKMILENGSIIMAESTSASAIRGYTLNLIILDEFAFVSNTLAEEFFTAVYPTISSGESTQIFVASTPCGLNHFYKMYTDGVEGRNGFKVLKITWDQVPGRTKAWAEDQRRVLGDSKFMQEMEADFQGSSNTLISSYYLKNMVYHEPLFTRENLDAYIAPIPGHIYIATVDVSRGAGIDYSAMLVFDVSQLPYQIVAKYKSNTIQPMLYPTIINKIAKDYNNAKVLIEINDIGGQVADILSYDLEYEHVIYTDKDVISEWGKLGNVGVRTTVKTRRIGCANLKQLIENDKLLINDFDIVAELATFIIYKGKYQADSGTHDDLVMCLILFAWMTTQQFFKDFTDSDIRKLMYAQQEARIDQELTPFGFVDDGVSTYDVIDITPTEVWISASQSYDSYLKELAYWG